MAGTMLEAMSLTDFFLYSAQRDFCRNTHRLEAVHLLEDQQYVLVLVITIMLLGLFPEKQTAPRCEKFTVPC